MRAGLGRIMAEVSLEQEKARISAGDSPACPFCGREMEASGVGFFCYGGPPHNAKCGCLPKIEDALGGTDAAQGALVAAVLGGDNRPLVKCYVVRGGFGRSNLRVSGGPGVDDIAIPELVREHGWTFLDEMIPVTQLTQKEALQ